MHCQIRAEFVQIYTLIQSRVLLSLIAHLPDCIEHVRRRITFFPIIETCYLFQGHTKHLCYLIRLTSYNEDISLFAVPSPAGCGAGLTVQDEVFFSFVEV